jgi:hypothetical protein
MDYQDSISFGIEAKIERFREKIKSLFAMNSDDVPF